MTTTSSTVALNLNTMSKVSNTAATTAQISEDTKSLLLKGKDSLRLVIVNEVNKVSSAAGSIQNAKTSMGYAESDTEPQTFSQLIDSAQTFQESINSAGEALNKLTSGEYTASDLLTYISNINNAMDKMDEDVDWESISSIDELKDKIQELADSYVDTFLAKNDIDAEPMVDGKIGFLYLNKNGIPTVALHWEKYFQHIVEKYNKIYKEQMPKVTPHVCRNTYCSHCASSGMNPKHLQYLMGHSDIGVTFNTYTHADLDNVRKEVKTMEKCVL